MNTLSMKERLRGRRSGFAKRLVALMLIVSGFAITGCGGGGGAAAVNVEPEQQLVGELSVAVTDAEGDFIAYTVDVVSLSLQAANGDLVETLPLTTRIDFTELTEVTEFLTVATVPAGNYESVIMTLDYQQAEVVAQDQNGDAVVVTAVDALGNTLGLFDVRIDLSDADTIRIAPGAPASFSLDFDLDASNEIDLDAAVPSVTVEPFLLATAQFEEGREHRVRGVLAAVDQANEAFSINVRPFRHRVGQFGRFTVNADDETQYEVDGVGLTGSAGLTAMAALGDNAPVIASGDISGRNVSADIVLAGSSVPWTDSHVVKGVVSSRSADVLTVRGVRVEYSDGIEVFRGEGTVLLGPTTTVTAPGVDNAELNIDSVSVGQRIVAFGELVDDQTLDASAGRVVMRMNQLTAQVVTTSPLSVGVYFLNGRKPSAFDFSGTGVDQSLDADPAHYEIDSGALSLDSVDDGDLVRVRGLVTSFGAAPADYTARTVIDVSTEQRPGSLSVVWPDGSQVPFHSVSNEMIDIDLSASREVLKLRGVPRSLINPLDSAMLLPTETGEGLYAVKVRGSGELSLFRSFDLLVDELNARLDDGLDLYRVSAQVRYTFDGTGFVTPRASFVFKSSDE